MKKVYHYTKLDILEKIITKDGLSLRGSYYKEFDLDDYKWTKAKVAPIINNICNTQKSGYDTDSLFKPIIISFSTNAESDFMWKNYADNYSGVQLAIDYELVSSVALKNLNYFNKCAYIEKSEEITNYLNGCIDGLTVKSINNPQENYEAISCLIKRPKFKVENEIRYVHPYSQMFSCTYDDFINNQNVHFTEITPKKDDAECYILLPKEALLSITIGHKSANKSEFVKRLLKEFGFNTTEVELRYTKIKI